VEPLTESAEGFEAGWVDNYVSVGLLVFAVFVFVAFVRCGSIGRNGDDPHSIRVSACYVNEVVRDVFAAEGDNIKAEVWFPRDGKSLYRLFNRRE
jgi:hypothetical protein